jgi:hypothetical protein
MYDVERSGETERISIRGSGRPGSRLLVALVDVVVAVDAVRFIS